MVKTKPVKKVALILLFAAMAVAQDTRPTVAILDFESQGISEQEVKTLTERMRSEIGATNAVRLIERKAIENIMAEQGLAQSGCVTDECAAEVGQLLGVHSAPWCSVRMHRALGRWPLKSVASPRRNPKCAIPPHRLLR